MHLEKWLSGVEFVVSKNVGIFLSEVQASKQCRDWMKVNF